MGVSYRIVYHHLVAECDIPKLSAEWKAKIKRAIETKLITEPEMYGKPLRRSLKGYYKLRVGDYRVIFRIVKITVKIFLIEHRSIVYSIIEKRI